MACTWRRENFVRPEASYGRILRVHVLLRRMKRLKGQNEVVRTRINGDNKADVDISRAEAVFAPNTTCSFRLSNVHHVSDTRVARAVLAGRPASRVASKSNHPSRPRRQPISSTLNTVVRTSPICSKLLAKSSTDNVHAGPDRTRPLCSACGRSSHINASHKL